MADEEVSRISSLLDEIIEAFRVQEGRLPSKWEQVCLGAVINSALVTFQTAGERHHFRLEGVDQATASVRGDFRELEQVVRNLVSNAIKYSPDGGEIRVALSTDPGVAGIAMSDNGLGVHRSRSPPSTTACQGYSTWRAGTLAVSGSGSSSAVTSCSATADASGPRAPRAPAPTFYVELPVEADA